MAADPMTEKLETLPCPFCGCDDIRPRTMRVPDTTATYELVTCSGCSASAVPEDWNTRSLPHGDRGGGWVMVPREPTEEMCEAGFEMGRFMVDGGTIYSDFSADPPELENGAPGAIYAAMLSAAPAAPVGEGETAPDGTPWKERAREFADVAMGNAQEIQRLLLAHETIARAGFEMGFNAGAKTGLESFCDALIVLADVPEIGGMTTPDAMRFIAHSMEQNGSVPFVLAETPPELRAILPAPSSPSPEKSA